MAYADQQMSSRKVVSIVLVALLHAALGYAFITGLAFNVVKKVAQDLKTFDVVEEPPPPEEEPPPPPPEQPQQEVPPPPMVTPPPVVVTPPIQAPQIQSVQTIPPVTNITPVAPTAPPAPPAPPGPAPAAVGAKPRGNPGAWLTDDDYPTGPRMANQKVREGRTAFRLTIDAAGKVTGCTVTGSSGSPVLDEQTCRLLPGRANRRGFTPAKDAAGNNVPATFTSAITWREVEG